MLRSQAEGGRGEGEGGGLQGGDDDDTHLCIRCNAKIIGLENYVEHRKSFCSTTKLINNTKSGREGGGEGGQEVEGVIARGEQEQEAEENSEERIKAVKTSSTASSVAAINNKDPLKFKAPPLGDGTSAGGVGGGAGDGDYGKSPGGAGRNTTGDAFGVKLSETSSYQDHQSNYSTQKEGGSGTGLEKCLVFNLDLELMDEEVVVPPSGSVRNVTDDYDYEEGANLFFSSLQLKREIVTKRIPEEHPGRTHQEEQTSVGKLNQSAETEDLTAVRTSSIYQLGESSEGEDFTDSDDRGSHLEEDDLDSDSDDEDEVENYRVPPRTHTGGKWKPDDRREPSGTSSRTVTRLRSPSPRYQQTHYSWTRTDASRRPDTQKPRQSLEEEEYPNSSLSPPQNYTRGKWVPGKEIQPASSSQQQPQSRRISEGTSISNRQSRSSESPTKEQQKITETVEVPTTASTTTTSSSSPWCSVCNRRLASQLIYQRHLTSNLHKKRAQLEIELEQGRVRQGGDAFGGLAQGNNKRQHLLRTSALPMSSIKLARPSSSEAGGGGGVAAPEKQKFARKLTGAAKRKSELRSVYPQTVEEGSLSVLHNELKRGRREEEEADEPQNTSEDPINNKGILRLKGTKRIRRRIYTFCDVCKLRLPIVLMGRHLLSHMHYRRRGIGQLNRPGGGGGDQRLILKHLDQIIRLSPFQCQLCRFYTTTHELFMRHWDSEEHQRKKVSWTWCSFCQFEGTSQEMREHLMGRDHEGVIQAVNRTYPIVIRERRRLPCVNCHRSFSSNMAIRKHNCKGGIEGLEVQEKPPIDTASDEYQSIHSCESCGEIFRKLNKLKQHQLESHGRKQFHCYQCILRFDMNEEAVRHRTSLEHKLQVAKLSGKEEGKRSRSCKDCNMEFKDALELREHVKERHREQKFSCLICGESFEVAQALSQHVRKKLCNPMKGDSVPDQSPGDGKESCPRCHFKSSSQSELLFHQAVLHDNPEMTYNSKAKIRCPLCVKEFKKASLIGHLRRHTNERLFACPLCTNSYTRKANLVEHMEKCRGRDRPGQGVPKVTCYSCDAAGCSFKTTSRIEMTRHSKDHLRM